jgi:hypothetical protein
MLIYFSTPPERLSDIYAAAACKYLILAREMPICISMTDLYKFRKFYKLLYYHSLSLRMCVKLGRVHALNGGDPGRKIAWLRNPQLVFKYVTAFV